MKVIKSKFSLFHHLHITMIYYLIALHLEDILSIRLVFLVIASTSNASVSQIKIYSILQEVLVLTMLLSTGVARINKKLKIPVAALRTKI